MENEKGKKHFLFLLLTETIVMVVLAGMLFSRNSVDTKTSITDWESRDIAFDHGWYVDENNRPGSLETNKVVDIIYGPYIDLKKGTYSVTVEYECDYDQNCVVYTMEENKDDVKSEPQTLRQNRNRTSFDFVLTGDVERLEVVVQYNGQGALRISNIEIKTNTTGFKKSLEMILFFFIMLDLCLYFAGRQKWPQMVMLLEAGVALFLLAVIIIRNNEGGTAVDTLITDWKSKYITYQDGWYIDEQIVKSNSNIEPNSNIESDTSMEDDFKVMGEGILKLLHGPGIELKKGSYEVKVEYECDENQSCLVCADSIYGPYIEAGEKNILSKNQTSVWFDFTLKEDIRHFEVLVGYNKTGKLNVKNIEIYPTTAGLQRLLAMVVLLSLGMDVCFYCRKSIRANKMFLLKICGMILLVSCPLLAKGIAAGHDITVHFMRIEGLAEELKRGVFPVKMSSLWMDGYGYPVSVFYGDFLLYIPAVLRIIGFSVTTAYKVYIFLINAGTVVISYICFKKIFQNKEAALLTTFAYASAGYRIVCLYVRSAVGEYSAMMFFPLIALAVYQLYTLNSENRKFYKQYAFVLALGMSGVIGSHILSTEMVVVTLAVLCIVLWKSTFRKYVLYGYILAVIETIVLNLYFIISFLDYYWNADVYINDALNYVKRIQGDGVYIGQYFAFFQNMFGFSGVNLVLRPNFTPGLPLMTGLVAAVVVWAKEKATKEIKLFLSFSIALLFMASNLFPWNFMALHCGWGNILAQVQFPWRYLGVATMFLTLLLGSVYGLFEKEEKYGKEFHTWITVACMIMMIFYISNYSNAAGMIYQYDTAEVDTYGVGGAEYLRVGTDTELFTGEIAHENMRKVSLLSRNGTHMELYCESGESDGVIELPMLHYKGYQIMDEHGNQYEITDGENNVIQFAVPAGFSGKIKVDFVEPWLWKLGETVSLLAVILICVKEIPNLYRMRHAKSNER